MRHASTSASVRSARACKSGPGESLAAAVGQQTEIGLATRLKQVSSKMLGCRRCPALVACRSRVVPGDGAVPADVVFIGIAPGRLGGDRTGIPFSGDRSGELLRRMVRQSGLRRVFITNLVRCNPRDERGCNRNPSRDEIANCRTHLETEIALVRPKAIVCLGALAWREIAGNKALFEPGRAEPAAIDGRPVYAVYHPAFVNRGAVSPLAYEREFARLAEGIARLAESSPGVPSDPDWAREGTLT